MRQYGPTTILEKKICKSKNPLCDSCLLEPNCKKFFQDTKHAQSAFKGSSREIRGKIIKYLINNENRITTIGRGGSDASAIMLAKFFEAEKCIIYTDVCESRRSAEIHGG